MDSAAADDGAIRVVWAGEGQVEGQVQTVLIHGHGGCLVACFLLFLCGVGLDGRGRPEEDRGKAIAARHLTARWRSGKGACVVKLTTVGSRGCVSHAMNGWMVVS